MFESTERVKNHIVKVVQLVLHQHFPPQLEMVVDFAKLADVEHVFATVDGVTAWDGL